MNKKFVNPFSRIIVTTDDASLSGKTLSAKDLFLEHNPNGYWTKPQLRQYVASLSNKRQETFASCLEALSEGWLIKSVLVITHDEFDEPTIWPRITVGETPLNFKIKATDWLLTFFKDYQRLKLANLKFTVDEIIDELSIVDEIKSETPTATQLEPGTFIVG